MTFPIISADSHSTEAPHTYRDYIDAKWKDKAPRLETLGDKGDFFVVDGMKRPDEAARVDKSGGWTVRDAKALNLPRATVAEMGRVANDHLVERGYVREVARLASQGLTRRAS